MQTTWKKWCVNYLHTERKVTQSQHVEQIIEVLSLLNNENTVVQIIQKVSKSSEKEVLEIITWLLKNHIVYDSRELYKWFHKVSQYPDQFISWEQVSYNLNSEIEKEGVSLPRPDKSELSEILEKRKSVRYLEKSPIAFKKLAKILYSMTEVEGIKTHASAGGLYPLSLYFHTFYDTEILPKGTYKYHNQSHKAIPQKTLLIEYLINAMSNETDLDSGIIIFIVANLGIHSQKYFNRGYRFTMQEAGMVVQNAYLSCSEQNLGICQYGAYDENILSQMLELPSNYEVVGVLRIGEICTSDETEVVNTKTQHQIDYLGGEIQNSDLQIRQLTCEGNRMGYWGTSVKFCYRDNLSAYANGVSYSREISQLKAMAEMHERICSGNITNTITAKARELSGKWYNPSLYFPLKKSI